MGMDEVPLAWTVILLSSASNLLIRFSDLTAVHVQSTMSLLSRLHNLSARIKQRAIRSRHHLQILFHTALIVVPLAAFTGILLGLVYTNLWDHSETKIETLSLSSAFSSEALFINYSATSLILVASWSSSVVLPLIGSFLTLTSTIIAADVKWLSERGHCTMLPTRRQLGILIDLIDGKRMALVTWFGCFWGRDRRRMPARWLLEVPAGVQLATLCLSVLVIAADTWLHVATKSISMWYLDPVQNISDAGPSYHYSRNLSEACLNRARSVCTVTLEQGSRSNVTAFTTNIKKLMLDDPLTDTRINASADGTLFLAPRAATYKQRLGEAPTFQTFTATTLQATANCSIKKTECRLATAGNETAWWQVLCLSGFSSNVTSEAPIHIGSWWNQTNSTTWFFDTLNASWYRDRPLQIGIATFINATDELRQLNRVFDKANSAGRGSVFTAQCNVTLEGAKYSWTNSTSTPIVRPSSLVKSADYSALAALLGGYFDSTSYFDQRQTQALTAQRFGVDTFREDDLLSHLNSVAARVSLSLLGGVIVNEPVLELSLASSAIVTRVEKAPLFTLVILNIWFAGFGMMLGLLALYITRDSTSRKDVFQVQELLTVNGLATAHAAIDTAAEEMDSNTPDTGHMRVGVIKKNGRWQFRYVNLDDGESETTKLLPEEESAID